MKEIEKNFTIIENRKLTHKTYLLRLKSEGLETPKPGQFVNITIPGKYLRRPISIHDYDSEKEELILLYDVAGEGTFILSKLMPNEKLNLLVNLGNGFHLPNDVKKPVLLGGGIGSAPLMYLARFLVYNGVVPEVVLGFNSEKDNFAMDKILRDIGIATYISTVDGTQGTKGFVTDAIRENNLTFDYFYACGPMPMLKALTMLESDGQISVESRMGCGFGACMCCSIQTMDGSKRICKEGPVFKKNELIWK